jgi:prepilin-type processing-associated H-X9-DG protein
MQVFSPPYHVMRARHAGGYLVDVVFADGSRATLDLSRYAARGGVFAPLARPDYFAQLFVDLHTLCWPNGADIAPERLYEMAALAKPPCAAKSPRRRSGQHRNAVPAGP